MSWSRFGVLCVIYVVAVPVTLLVALVLAWWGGGVGALGVLASLVVATSALFFRRAPHWCAAVFIAAAAVVQVALCWSYATEATAENKYSDIAEAASFSNAFWLVGTGIGVVGFAVGLSAFVTNGARDGLLVVDGGLIGAGSIMFWILVASTTAGVVGVINAGPIALYALAAVIAAATPRQALQRATGDLRPV
jgi:hypothetical protein